MKKSFWRFVLKRRGVKASRGRLARAITMLATAEKLLAEGLQTGASLVDLPYSPYALELFKLAQEAASSHGHDVVGSGHLLLAVLSMHKGLP